MKGIASLTILKFGGKITHSDGDGIDLAPYVIAEKSILG
jgi:hypothetical protein